MNAVYFPYIAATSILFVLLFPVILACLRVTGRYSDHLRERLGLLPEDVTKRLSGSPRIWIHAVSMGEVKVSASIIGALRRLRPDCAIIVSTFTESGRNMAGTTFGDEIPIIYAPIDFIGSVRCALSTIRPDVLVFLETEIWPIWLRQAHRMGIKTVLINGRISFKSIKGYLRMKFFFREVLKNFDAFSMIMQADADRIRSMGAAPEKIETNGNAKYDLLSSAVNPETQIRVRMLLNLHESDIVFVAGSTRNGEEDMILNAYTKIIKKFPNTLLIIIPRHIDRQSEIGASIEKGGFEYQLLTDIKAGKERRTKLIVIGNTFGELFDIYSAGTIVFCGGSLTPQGGQNPLEPAVWEKPVFYGPHMDNFLDAKGILESHHAGVEVADSDVLANKAIWFLEHPEELQKYGERARQAVMKNEGAAIKHAELILRLLNDR